MSFKFVKTHLKPEFFTQPLGLYTRASRHSSASEIGLELELEGFGASLMPQATDQIGGYWLTHTDPSLRGEACELVLRRPVSYVELSEKVIPEYTKIIADTRFKPALSNRCSFHVHLDFSHKTLYDLIRFITVYSMFEQYFFSAAGPERRGNHFCVSLKEAETFVDGMIKSLSSGDFSFAQPEDNRYMALNLAALYKFGSVEVRLHEGVSDPDKIFAWVDVLYELLQYAKNNYEDTPQELIEQVSMNGFERVAEQKFPKTWAFIKPFYTSAFLRDGLDIAQDLAYSVMWDNAPREALKEPAKKSRANKSATINTMQVTATGLRPMPELRPLGGGPPPVVEADGSASFFEAVRQARIAGLQTEGTPTRITVGTTTASPPRIRTEPVNPRLGEED